MALSQHAAAPDVRNSISMIGCHHAMCCLVSLQVAVCHLEPITLVLYFKLLAMTMPACHDHLLAMTTCLL
jgi:hypothetical protein